MNGPYVNDDGDIWIERGSTTWPRAQREAAVTARDIGDYYSVSRYEGIDLDVRVSDEHEYAHGDDDACADSQDMDYDDPNFTPCCRTVAAYHFRSVEP